MPEGDTVWLTARRLHEALAGSRLTATDFRVPRLATLDLAGRAVREVRAAGKHLLLRFDDDRTLHSHLRMDGSWRVFGRGARWSGGPRHAVRVILSTAGHDAVGYRVHDLALLPTAEEDRYVGHLGPDLLSAGWDDERDIAEAVRRIRATPDRVIAAALLDQRNLAGIGNLYAVEMLFIVGVTPWTPVTEVPDLPGLVRLGRRLLRMNRDDWPQPTTGSARRGEEHWVHGRQRRPCRRCGTPIRAAWLAEKGRDPAYRRLAFWCPTCQRGPAPQ